MLKLKNKLDIKKQFKFDLKMKFGLTGVICLIIVIVFYLLSSNYHSGKSSTIIQQAKFLQDSYKSKYQHLVNLEEAAKETATIKKNIDTIQAAMLPHSSTSTAMDQISEIGANENLKFVYFKPKKMESFKNYNIIPINISVSGEYQDMIDFLEKIATLKRTVVISKFVLMRRGKKGNEVILNAQLDIFTAAPKKTAKKQKGGKQ